MGSTGQTANARTMSLSLQGARFRVIGTDAGLIHAPYETDRVQIAVGQRYDLEVTYDQPGQVDLLSHVLVLEGENVVERPFVVQSVQVEASDEAPTVVALPTVPPVQRGRTNVNATLVFDAVEDPETGVAQHQRPVHAATTPSSPSSRATTSAWSSTTAPAPSTPSTCMASSSRSSPTAGPRRSSRASRTPCSCRA
ncbi:MAG: hypothetical protein R3F60_19660 [bacterium]